MQVEHPAGVVLPQFYLKIRCGSSSRTCHHQTCSWPCFRWYLIWDIKQNHIAIRELIRFSNGFSSWKISPGQDAQVWIGLAISLSSCRCAELLQGQRLPSRQSRHWSIRVFPKIPTKIDYSGGCLSPKCDLTHIPMGDISYILQSRNLAKPPAIEVKSHRKVARFVRGWRPPDARRSQLGLRSFCGSK